MAKYIAWFSCGAASAVAAKIAIAEFGIDNVRIIYQDTGSEHDDNLRFLSECEEWYGKEIEVTRSEKYKSVDDVIEKTRYIAGVAGARCTGELKRKVAESLINFGKEQEVEIIGYTVDEANRCKNIQATNNERKFRFLLIERGLTKSDCLGILDKKGIELPVMYRLGYENNNCIGCVKGQAGYWNKIKIDFPEVFNRRALQERELNVAINKRFRKPVIGEEHLKKDKDGNIREKVFLDELPEDMGNYKNEANIECGIFCQIESSKI